VIPIEVKVETTTRFGRVAWREASKDAWLAAGAFWHETILPKHFEPQAGPEYGYAFRTRKYLKQKLTAKGHARPLVYKGELERAVKRMRDLTGSRARGDDEGGVNVKLSGPRYLHQRQQPGQPNLAAELSAVSKRDADAIAEVIDQRVTAALGEDGPSQDQ